ncbi:MAG: hypothetical protein M3290_05600 [Actinomycetota bacterium]|nr:hypothetical protein [Actinomycetota bacterium]
MSPDTKANQPVAGGPADDGLASVYDPNAYVVQGTAIIPLHKRPSGGSRQVSTSDEAELRSRPAEPEPVAEEQTLPERIAEQIAAEVAAEVAPERGVSESESADAAVAGPAADTFEAEADDVAEPAQVEPDVAEPDTGAITPPAESHRLARRGPRRVNEGALYRAREFEAVHAERRESMTRRTHILAFGIAGFAVLLGGGAVASGLADSRSILVGTFCFGAPLLLQLIVSVWLEESIRAVRAQDYLTGLEAAINEHLEHASVGFETWLRRPHSKLELPFRWIADFAVVLSLAVAVIGWESAHLSGIDFLWAVLLPAVIAVAGRVWAEQTLKHLENESRRRIRLDP